VSHRRRRWDRHRRRRASLSAPAQWAQRREDTRRRPPARIRAPWRLVRSRIQSKAPGIVAETGEAAPL